MKLQYDVEADWLILKTCNFRCSYCFEKQLSEQIQVHASAEKWAEGFDATGKTWLIHISGGEPTIYPGFVDLCRNLSRNHYLSINTNLSGNCVELFTETIDPNRVHYINASLHYTERQKKNSFSPFFERVNNLRRRGFNVMLSIVMTPDVIGIYPDISAELSSHGLAGVPKIMRGVWNGKKYPAAYTIEERYLVRRYLSDAVQAYAPMLTEMGEAASINMFADESFVSGVPSYIGKRCGSGFSFVRIDPKGDVRGCKPRNILGNILQKNVKLVHEPERCISSFCHYYCEKYTSAAYVGKQPAGAILINKLINLCRDFREKHYSGRTI